MPAKAQNPAAILAEALARYRNGFDPELIEIPEAAAALGFGVAPATLRKSRCTGLLLGRPAPRFVRRGRTIRYRLKAQLDWLAEGDTYSSTAEAATRHEGRGERARGEGES